MSDLYWIFGTFVLKNRDVDPAITPRGTQPKWRSQEPIRIDLGIRFYPRERVKNYDPIYIGTTEPVDKDAQEDRGKYSLTHLVYISDLQYQLRNTDPVGDNYRILIYKEAGAGGEREYLGFNFRKKDEVLDTERRVLTAENPNPQQFQVIAPYPKPYVKPEFVNFAEERLELGYDYGCVGGPEFKTEMIEVADGREARNSLRHLPLGRWQLGQRAIAESETDLLEEVSYLKQFHQDRLGSYQGFRFKDWADYKAVNQYIATGDGVKSQFQLRKAYLAGNAVTYRPIVKPVSATVEVFVDGINAADWVVDLATGVISHDEPLSNGAVLTATYEFDVPVWFETDEIGFSLQGYDPDSGDIIYQLESVFVVEGRIPLSLPWTIEPAREIAEDLDLGIVYETIEKYQFSTDYRTLQSGYQSRFATREESRLFFDLGSRNYDREELDRLLSYFWNARGKAGEFPLVNLGKNYKVRFNTDKFNSRFEAAQGDDALFNLSGLKLQLKEQTLYKLPPFSIELEPIFIDPQDSSNPKIREAGDSQYRGSLGTTGDSNASLPLALPALSPTV